jgi:hypothetical protein
MLIDLKPMSSRNWQGFMRNLRNNTVQAVPGDRRELQRPTGAAMFSLEVPRQSQPLKCRSHVSSSPATLPALVSDGATARVSASVIIFSMPAVAVPEQSKTARREPMSGANLIDYDFIHALLTCLCDGIGHPIYRAIAATAPFPSRQLCRSSPWPVQRRRLPLGAKLAQTVWKVASWLGQRPSDIARQLQLPVGAVGEANGIQRFEQ